MRLKCSVFVYVSYELPCRFMRYRIRNTYCWLLRSTTLTFVLISQGEVMSVMSSDRCISVNNTVG